MIGGLESVGTNLISLCMQEDYNTFLSLPPASTQPQRAAERHSAGCVCGRGNPFV